MKYTNLEKAENITKSDYSKKVLFSLQDFLPKAHQLQTVTIPPQTRQRSHYHTIQTEVFYILEGQGEVGLAGEVYDARPGDAFICSPNEIHYYWNKTDSNFVFLVFKIDYPEVDDTVWLE